jgi:hypothetical protein
MKGRKFQDRSSVRPTGSSSVWDMYVTSASVGTTREGRLYELGTSHSNRDRGSGNCKGNSR